MVKGITLEMLGVPDLHSRSQEQPPKLGIVPAGPLKCLLAFKDINNQLLRICNDKRLGALKITYVHQHWSQECP